MNELASIHGHSGSTTREKFDATILDQLEPFRDELQREHTLRYILGETTTSPPFRAEENARRFFRRALRFIDIKDSKKRALFWYLKRLLKPEPSMSEIGTQLVDLGKCLQKGKVPVSKDKKKKRTEAVVFDAVLTLFKDLDARAIGFRSYEQYLRKEDDFGGHSEFPVLVAVSVVKQDLPPLAVWAIQLKGKAGKSAIRDALEKIEKLTGVRLLRSYDS